VVATTTLLFIVKTFDGADVVGDKPARWLSRCITNAYDQQGISWLRLSTRLKASSTGRVLASVGGAWLSKLFSSR